MRDILSPLFGFIFPKTGKLPKKTKQVKNKIVG